MSKKTKQKKEKAFTMTRSILRRSVRQSIAVSFVTIVLLTTFSFLVARALIEARTLSQVASIASAKEDYLEAVLNNDRQRTSIMSSRDEIIDALNGNVPQSELNELLDSMRNESIYATGLYVIDELGNIQASAGTYSADIPQALSGKATVLIPLVGESGWQGYVVRSAIMIDGDVRGYLNIQYSTQQVLGSLVDPILGQTGEMLLGREDAGQLVLVEYEGFPDKRPLILGSLEEQYSFGSSIAKALKGEEEIKKTEDYRGHQVYSATRVLPSLGWGLTIKVDTSEALRGVKRLAITLALIGLGLMGISGMLGILFAHQLIDPLIILSKRVSRLGPGNWGHKITTNTGDEVELLDRHIGDMAGRLKLIYEDLEAAVQQRTQELKEQYLKDRAILSTIRHGVVVVDASGELRDINPAAEKMMNVQIEDALGHHIEDVLVLKQHHKDMEKKNHPINQCLQNGKEYRSLPNAHLNIFSDEENLVPITLIVTPLLQDKKVVGAVAVFQDVTEERKVDYLKSEFISLASHQLRTPISTLQWYIELFSDESQENFTDVQKESLTEMERATKRMTMLVETLLHAAQLEGDGVVADTKKVNMSEYVEDIGSELRALGKDSKISCEVKAPKKQITANTDPLLLHIVFQNLFSNAVKYSKSGGNVVLELSETAKDVVISITDAGIGIPEKDTDRIFQRLFRASNVLKIDTDGNGLGLYISRMVMDILGGTISFESTENKGTTFTVKIPKK